jgi:hypothetical protein
LCFVQVDHELRDGLEHKIERELWQNAVEEQSGGDGEEDRAGESPEKNLGLSRRLHGGASGTSSGMSSSGRSSNPLLNAVV